MIKATFKLSDMQNYAKQQVDRVNKAVISTYQFVGETFVRNARLSGNYNDITGNLRSSIFYIIMSNGKVVDENFEEGSNGSDRATGTVTAQQLAEELASEYPKGIVLILGAGMHYAKYVEDKGREVISASSSLAATQLKELISEL